MNKNLLPLILFFVCFWASPTFAQSTTSNDAESRQSYSESTNLHLGPVTMDFGPPVLILFGAFCALWAQNTGRNCWLWFFLGLLFSVITIFFLLTKNANDLQNRRIRDQIGR